MWRKSDEAKPSSAGSTTPEPAATPSKQNQPAAAPVSSPEIAATIHASSLSGFGTSASAGRTRLLTPASSSTIGPGLKIRGDITGDSNLIIEGEAQGKSTNGNGRVTVRRNGNVNADIEAAQIIIEGDCTGKSEGDRQRAIGPGQSRAGEFTGQTYRY